MIRKNVASQVIYLPALLLTANGTAVTSGATMTVSKDGAEAGSAGTLAHSAGGVWKYTPTQSETNCGIMALILTATSAMPVVLNLVTTVADTTATAFGAMPAYTQPTGFLAATFPSGTVANTTNITAGTITTTTNLTNLPAITAGWITAAGIAADAITDAKVAADVTIASVTGAVGSVTGAVGSVTGNVGGNVAGSVGSVAAAVTLPTMPTNWLTAAGLAADAVSEIQSGLATPTNITAATGVVLSGVTHTGAVIPTVSAVTGLTAANLDVAVSTLATQASVNTIDDFLDTEVAAIKAKTDQFVFTVANQVDSNTLSGGGLDAAGVRAAVGLATANLDTQLADLPTNAELATSQAAADDATLAAIAALNNISAAQVNAEVDAALVDIHLDHLLAADYDPASKPGSATALLNELIGNDAGVSQLTANALELAPTGGSAPTVEQIRTEMDTNSTKLADILADTAVIGATGAGLTSLATQASLNALDDYVDTEVAAIKAKTDQLTFTVTNQVDSNALSGAGGLDAAGVRAAVGLATANLDTQLADLPTNAELSTSLGTADDAVLAAVAALNNLSSAQVQTLLTTLKADLATDHGSGAWTTANVAGLATQASVDIIDNFLDTEVAAIKAVTDQFVFTVPNQVDANALTGGGSGLDAAATRAALGLASANLDTQLADLPTVSEFNARTIAAASYFDPAVDTVIVGTNNDKTGYTLSQSFPANFASLGINASGHITRVVLVDTTTTNTDMRGTDGANTTTPPTVAQIRTEMDSNSTQLAAIVADTNELQTDWANGGRLDLIVDSLSTQTSVDDLPTSAELATALGTADDAVLAAIAALNNLSAAQVNAEVDTALADVGLTTTITGRIDVASSTRASQTSVDTLDNFVDTEVAAIKAVTDQFVFTVANQVDSNTLSGGGLDAAGVRAAVGLASANLDTQIADLPTNAELATSQASADDATLAAIAALNNLSAAQVNAEVDTALLDVGLTATITGRVDAAVSTRASQATLDTLDNYVDTEVAAIKAVTDQFVFSIANQVDCNVLTGGGSGLDAAQTRAALGLASANLDTQLADLPTGAELTAALAAADDAVLAAVGSPMQAGSTVVLSATTHTGAVIPTVTNLSNAPTAGDLTATMKASVTTAATAATPTAAAVTAAVTLPTMPTDWITAAGLAASAVAEIQSGLATQASVNTIDDFLDTEVAAIKAQTDLIPSDPADASVVAAAFAAVDAKLDTIDNFVDTEVAAIKAKTDQLTFTVAGQVDANSLSGSLSAAGVRSAVGLASANLDTQLADLPTVSEFNARTLAAAAYFDPAADAVIVGTNNDKTGYTLSQSFPPNFAALGITASGHVSRVVLVDTTTTNTDMRGTNGANTTTPPTVAQIRTEMDANSTVLAGIAADTNDLQTSVADLPTSAELNAALDTADDAVLAAIAALNNLSSAQVSTLLTALATTLSTAHGAGSWATADVSALATAAALAAVKADTLIAKHAGVVKLGTTSNASSANAAYTYGGITVTFSGLNEQGDRSGVTIT